MRLSGAWDDSAYTTHDGTTGGGVADGPSGAFARVRAVPLQDTNSPATLLGVLAAAREAGAAFTSVVGVRPTGWTHTNARRGKGGGAGDKAGGVQSSIATIPAAGGAGGAGEKGNPAGGGGGSANGDNNLGESESPPDGFEDQDDEAAAWGAGDGFEEEGGGDGRCSSSAEPPPPSWAGKKPWVDGNARVRKESFLSEEVVHGMENEWAMTRFSLFLFRGSQHGVTPAFLAWHNSHRFFLTLLRCTPCRTPSTALSPSSRTSCEQ